MISKPTSLTTYNKRGLIKVSFTSYSACIIKSPIEANWINSDDMRR